MVNNCLGVQVQPYQIRRYAFSSVMHQCWAIPPIWRHGSYQVNRPKRGGKRNSNFKTNSALTVTLNLTTILALLLCTLSATVANFMRCAPKTGTGKIRYQIARQTRRKPLPVFQYRFSAPISGNVCHWCKVRRRRLCNKFTCDPSLKYSLLIVGISSICLSYKDAIMRSFQH